MAVEPFAINVSLMGTADLMVLAMAVGDPVAVGTYKDDLAP